MANGLSSRCMAAAGRATDTPSAGDLHPVFPQAKSWGSAEILSHHRILTFLDVQFEIPQFSYFPSIVCSLELLVHATRLAHFRKTCPSSFDHFSSRDAIVHHCTGQRHDANFRRAWNTVYSAVQFQSILCTLSWFPISSSTLFSYSRSLLPGPSHLI
jgi:hypothetical protein